MLTTFSMVCFPTSQVWLGFFFSKEKDVVGFGSQLRWDAKNADWFFVILTNCHKCGVNLGLGCRKMGMHLFSSSAKRRLSSKLFKTLDLGMKITSKDDFSTPALKMSSVVLRQTVMHSETCDLWAWLKLCSANTWSKLFWQAPQETCCF